jgi:DNA-binding NtrC family response regulator
MDGDQLDTALFGVFGVIEAKENGDTSRGLERISRGGLLYEANGGTLYLQNVSEASARVQARLARILRDREAVLVETGETISLEVRPMAGVAPDATDAALDGRLREDLFRRLSAFCIDVPPLRKRREDIPTLVNYFLREICAGLGAPPAVLSRSALSLICALPWRQNAVELRSLLEAIVAGLGNRGGIGIEDVLAHLRLDGDAVDLAHSGTLRQARIRFEREYISAVLDQHRGRISDAARVLGIQRTNLYRKMRSLHVGRVRKDASPLTR